MSEETERIAILLQARDRDFQRAMDRNNRLIAKFERDATRGTTQMSRNVERNMGLVSRAMSSVAAGFLAGGPIGIITAVGAATVGTLAQVSKGIATIGDEARRSGLGTTAFQELSFVATQSRIPVDALIDGMKELNLRADEFVTTGGGSAADAFKRIGLEGAELASALEDPKELMLDIIDRMESLDEAAQIRVADEIFGGTGGERFVELLAQGDEGVRQLIERAHEVGAVMDEDMIEKAAELDRKFSEIQTRVSSIFKTMVIEGVDAFDTLFDAMQPTLDEIDRAAATAERLADLGIDGGDLDASSLDAAADTAEAAAISYDYLAVAAREAAAAISSGILDFGHLVDAGEALRLLSLADEMRSISQALQTGQGDSEALAARLDEVRAEAETAVQAMRQIDGVSVGGIIGRLSQLGGALNTVRNLANAAAAAVATALQSQSRPVGQQRSADRLSQQEDRLGNIPMAPEPAAPVPFAGPRPEARDEHDIDLGYYPETGGGGGGGGGGGSGGGGAARQSDYAREVESIRERTAALELEAAELIAVAASGRDMADAIEFARQRAELLTAAQEDGREITPELREEIDALAEAYITAGDNAEEAADRIERIRENAETGADAMSDLFMAITEGGDSARQALSRLILQLAQVQISRGFGMLSQQGGWVGAAFGALGAGLSGERARGGSVRAGSAYLVNEDTPNSEIFVPSRSGAILNVPQAQAALSSAAGAGGGRTEIVVRHEPGVIVEIVENRAGAMIQQNNAALDSGFNARARGAVQDRRVR
ncbi:hypothetical protein [Wenxinia saemankumensis]|uniref:Uncharacterized protein n=1 Tax=Wenxinia saemankumensis TaxID=1447782 RepID=A0A1M6F074_9RHOB|nr:hypothetical protein [Wenxinia saemankumensis]SHI91087.1 hypothetical protein SAMN05444417_2278 [Wenxinia saemankumensis]